jgi:hypothetical protein
VARLAAGSVTVPTLAAEVAGALTMIPAEEVLREFADQSVDVGAGAGLDLLVDVVDCGRDLIIVRGAFGIGGAQQIAEGEVVHERDQLELLLRRDFQIGTESRSCSGASGRARSPHADLMRDWAPENIVELPCTPFYGSWAEPHRGAVPSLVALERSELELHFRILEPGRHQTPRPAGE